jgi:DNA-binding response OmpR family regulator
MALCERCEVELGGYERLPAPWFDDDQRTVGGQRLSAKNWQLLQILWSRRDRYVSRQSLMALLYGDRSDPPFDAMIPLYIWRTRRVLAATPFVIQNRYDFGWRLRDLRQKA